MPILYIRRLGQFCLTNTVEEVMLILASHDGVMQHWCGFNTSDLHSLVATQSARFLEGR